MKKSYIVFFVFILLCLNACQQKQGVYTFSQEDLKTGYLALEKSIMQDAYSPPVASRIYAYSLLELDYVLNHADAGQAVVDQISHFPAYGFSPEYAQEHSALAVLAFYELSKKLVFTDTILENTEKKFLKQLSEIYTSSKLQALQKEAAALSLHFKAWADQDRYKQTRTDYAYTLSEDAESWRPTAPDYLDAMEPNWYKLRPFLIDSSAQFPAPAPPTALSEMKMVYDEVNHLTKEKIAIAKFWEDTPAQSNVNGHFMYVEKKLTPVGHWLQILLRVADKENISTAHTVHQLGAASAMIYDGILVCWHTKYAMARIRPITVIQQHLDQNWKPLLITPQFPEYTSGHSVISHVAATYLTHVYGENYKYTDDVNTVFGIPARSYTSFLEASQEASLSRFYSGMHFLSGCDAGAIQGKKVAAFCIEKKLNEK